MRCGFHCVQRQTKPSQLPTLSQPAAESVLLRSALCLPPALDSHTLTMYQRALQSIGSILEQYSPACAQASSAISSFYPPSRTSYHAASATTPAGNSSLLDTALSCRRKTPSATPSRSTEIIQTLKWLGSTGCLLPTRRQSTPSPCTVQQTLRRLSP